jgi:hypothetical protein
LFDVITIDFRKAFDVIPHDRLIQKLSTLGVCEPTLRWISAFLANRKQCVCVNGVCSSYADVSSGIIQGSVLGPILFTLYINDLPANCPDCVIKLFADDVKAYKRIRSAADRLALQSSLNAICEWAELNMLGLSIDKCCYLQLGYTNLTLIYMLNSEILSPCESIIDMGINVH